MERTPLPSQRDRLPPLAEDAPNAAPLRAHRWVPPEHIASLHRDDEQLWAIRARLNKRVDVTIGRDPFLDDIAWVVGWIAGGVLALGLVLTAVRL